eukprot:TRINITY_DN63843_c0_g1_i1.p1 TRINITY_DN63843_c0_g1~~TRINITY_DN63843_c0_g1_i1.p1  ORF type:complete len:473 (+),score=68.26 TRINITY_DN63843_c0_g1_i1:86-1504(+)
MSGETQPLLGKKRDAAVANREDTALSAGTAEVFSDVLAAAPDKFAAYVGAALCAANASDAMETISVGYILPQLRHEFPDHVNVITSAVFAGMLMGSLLSGFVVQSLGPKAVLVTALHVEALAAALGATSHSGFVFACWRCVSGLAVGLTVPSLFALAQELLQPEIRRHRWLNVIATTFITGTVITASLAWGTLGKMHQSWRVFYALTGIVPLISAQMVSWFVPESVEFLLNRDRYIEVQDVLKSAGAATIPPEKLIHGKKVRDVDATNEWKELLAGPWNGSLARLTLACSSNSFAWYGLGTWLLVLMNQLGVHDTYSSAILYSLSGIPGCLCRHFLIDKVSPTKLFVAILGSTGLCCFALAFLARTVSLTPPFVVIFILCLFNSLSTASVNVQVSIWASPFPVELQPKALAFQCALMRIASIVAQVVDGKLLQAGDTKNVAILNGIVMSVAALSCIGLQTNFHVADQKLNSV